MKFFKELQKRVFPTIIALSALSVSASAAFYSVTGLSKLFAGAQLQVLIMAGSLEIAKLVIASLLYQYWGQLNRLLRVYLTMAATVLVLITSAGIYGFLSSAYQETANMAGVVDKEIELLELKKNRFDESRTYYISEKQSLDQSIKDLREGLSNNVIQYKDKETGQIITTTSSSTRRALQAELNTAIDSRNDISKKLEVVTDSITSLEIQILEVESNSDVASELGPLKYISELTGTPMNMVVNILMLVIIFVFDPLAISLVIAANFAFDRLKSSDSEEAPSGEFPEPANITDEDLNRINSIIEKKEVLDKEDVIKKYAKVESEASNMSSVRDTIREFEEMELGDSEEKDEVYLILNF